MKIAITCRNPYLNAEVDPRFGRAEAFVVYDIDTGAFEVVDNQQNLDAPQGAGIQAAESVSEAGAEYVLTGHCGPKAFRALTAAGIKVIVGLEGTVKDAVERFRAGELAPTESADVAGHWA